MEFRGLEMWGLRVLGIRGGGFGDLRYRVSGFFGGSGGFGALGGFRFYGVVLGFGL